MEQVDYEDNEQTVRPDEGDEARHEEGHVLNQEEQDDRDAQRDDIVQGTTAEGSHRRRTGWPPELSVQEDPRLQETHKYPG